MKFQYVWRLRTKFCNIVLHYWVFIHKLVVFTGPVTLEDKAIKLFQNVGQQTHSDRAPYSREQILNSIILRAWKLACPASVHENLNVDVPGKWEWNRGSKPWSHGPLHPHLLLYYGNLRCGHMKHWVKDAGESNSQHFQLLLPRLEYQMEVCKVTCVTALP